VTLAAGSGSGTGYRVWSGQSNSLSVPPYAYLDTTPYSSIPYDNSWDISSGSGTYIPNQETQIINGAFRSKGTTQQGYFNYSNFFYNATTKNTVNYSAISGTGYRFATFVWQAGVYSAKNYNTLSFL
jgi:hypothetical protein